jgi:ring-1,2-phenylacetyl-CoA epoxidase subunit PaaE
MLTFHSLRVVDIHPEAEDAVGISLEVPPELHAAYQGLPGQHVVVRTEINDEENRRTYSLVNAPGELPLRIVLRVHPSGHMSRYLAEQLNVGDSLDVLPPNGSFTPRRPAHEAGTYVAFASGCGITPVLSVIRSLLAANQRNRVILFYGNASTGRAMCVEELLGLKDRYLQQLSLHFLMSREPQESELYNGRIDAGRVRQLAEALFTPGDVNEFFVCGPGNMIDEVSASLRELGVAGEKIHGEHFTVATTTAVSAQSIAASASGAITVEFDPVQPAAITVDFDEKPSDAIAVEFDAPPTAVTSTDETVWAPKTKSAVPSNASAPGFPSAAPSNASAPGAPSAAPSQPGAPGAPSAVPSKAGVATEGATASQGKPALAPDQSEVTVLMDGRRRTFTMRMNDDVVLDAAMRAGLELPFSCRAGVCSTCRTKVVRGEVEMAQNYALEEYEVEQGYVLACQSRVKTPVLELDYDEK